MTQISEFFTQPPTSYFTLIALIIIFITNCYSRYSKKNQQNPKNNNNVDKSNKNPLSTIQLLIHLFPNYIWFGFSLMLISIILDYGLKPESMWLKTIISLIQSIGISIFISAIFTFAASTSEFTNKIREFLEDIIIKRNFLANIEPNSKKEALRALIRASDKEIHNRPNINNYYEYFINNILSITHKNVRSNYSIHTKVYIDKNDKCIKAQGFYTYRLYPSENGYNPITIGFDDNKKPDSHCKYLKIYNQKGEQKKFEKEALSLGTTKEESNTNKAKTESNIEESSANERKIELKDDSISKDQQYLDIELEVIEVGDESSLLLVFKALQPTNGFKFTLECDDDDLIIENHSVFVVNAKYYEETYNNNKKIHIVCNQWINEGSGVCVSILKK